MVDGGLGTCTVLALDADTVTLRCTFDVIPVRPSVDLLLALPRPKVMQRLWAQVAALGVGRIILTNATRVERNYFDTHVLEPDSYRPLLLEGLQQARDTHLPVVSIHRRLKVLLEDDLDGLCPSAARLVAHPGSTATFQGSPRNEPRPRAGEDPHSPRGRPGRWLDRLRIAAPDGPRLRRRRHGRAHAEERHRVRRPARPAARSAPVTARLAAIIGGALAPR